MAKNKDVTLLYNGAVKLEFDHAKHRYSVDGNPVYGVTTVLKTINKPALMPWAAKMGSEYLVKELKPGTTVDELDIDRLAKGIKSAYRQKADNSANIGTLAHDWCEKYIIGEFPDAPTNPDLNNISQAFVEFVSKHHIDVIHTERKLYSRIHNFAGTADLIAMFDGELAILDYKTTASGIYNEHFFQLGAYSIAYKEETGKQPVLHVIVNVNKHGELKVEVNDNVLRNEEAFKSVLSLTKYLEDIDRERKQ
jgi:hypothetical protein